MSFRCWDEPSEWVARMHAAEEALLAACAMPTARSAGRRHPEPDHPYRSAFVRDRDRIIHSAAFRRLMFKTQVFSGERNDHQRTRLTHTLEVAQIARTLARNLRLNEDLTEAAALAHDLGHPPFGHAGERALAQLMAPHGGFEHNRQGLRLLERLEDRYPSFPGLNLSYEVLESVALHSAERDHPDLADFGPEQGMLAESQVVDVADSIAYDAHDIDDALRAGLIGFGDLRETSMWRDAECQARQRYGKDLDGKPLARAVIRCLIDWQVSSALRESGRRLTRFASPAEVKSAQGPAVQLEPAVAERKTELERFLFERVYRHEQVVHATLVAERMVAQLFEELCRDPSGMPEKHRRRMASEPRERIVCDYVAGMTDRFCQQMHRERFGR